MAQEDQRISEAVDREYAGFGDCGADHRGLELRGHAVVELADSGLFGWHVITFWQALGILILSKILLGGFRGRPGPHMYWRRGMMERWAHMTPEEREKFRQSMRGRCGPWGSSAAEPKANA